MGVLGQWWRRPGGGRRLTASELAGAHLLLLPSDVPQAEVSAAVRCRCPDAPSRSGALVLSEDGPALLHPALDLSPRAAARAGVTGPWRRALALAVPPQREATHPLGPDRDGLHRAFPAGLPTGSEAEGLRLLLGLARRFGGAVRIAGSGEVLEPDPLRAVDHLVRTTTWLEPEDLLEALGDLLPDAEAARSGDLEELVDGGPVPLDVDHLVDLGDADADAGGPVPEPYVVSAALDGIDVLLLVHPEEEMTVPAPADAATTTTYEVRWDSTDGGARLAEEPDERHRAERARAQAVVARVSAAVLDRTGGIILDEDLLPVLAAGPPPGRGPR
ncbi:hypothetical protein CLV92_102175 [Kineococcus xinjiangensis]|uniref:Uncharacterized protein n=1 Tax=Kineococcus xinjiangensis TaxID=512762 RepID=A0A2S6IV44_9ACTN|nr:hypothetical protein [Kineococcus xinjiangensis]PPK98023.1 hypothetical protein CLV92_102175 [Kineococcus xinjiangensis]